MEHFQSRLRYGILFWGGEWKSVTIFRVLKKLIWLFSGVHKLESCRHIFRKFHILTLASLYILEVLWFIKKYKGNLKQNFGIHGHNTRNKFDKHTWYCSTVLYQWSVTNMGINYVITYHYESNNWTIIEVLREKWALFSYIMHFIQLKNFCNLREFSTAHCVGTIITNYTCLHILPLSCYNYLMKFSFVLW